MSESVGRCPRCKKETSSYEHVCLVIDEEQAAELLAQLIRAKRKGQPLAAVVEKFIA